VPVWTAPGQNRSVSLVDQPATASFNLMFDRLLMLEQLGLIPAPA
jgi:hypothetical protein